MKRAIKANFVHGSTSVPFVGVIADSQQGWQVGHAVVDDLAALLVIIGNGDGLSVKIGDNPPRAVRVTVVEFETKTLRFRFV